MYEVFEHTADLGLRVRAASRVELFAEAGRALMSVLIANLDGIQPVQERQLRVAGTEDDYLLLDWLNELLYCFDVERMALVEFHLTFDQGGLTARCRGELLDEERHRLEHEVKAITYHGLTVRSSDEGWLAEVIVDI